MNLHMVSNITTRMTYTVRTIQTFVHSVQSMLHTVYVRACRSYTVYNCQMFRACTHTPYTVMMWSRFMHTRGGPLATTGCQVSG